MNNIEISIYQMIGDVAKTVLIISSRNPEQSEWMKW